VAGQSLNNQLLRIAVSGDAMLFSHRAAKEALLHWACSEYNSHLNSASSSMASCSRLRSDQGRGFVNKAQARSSECI